MIALSIITDFQASYLRNENCIFGSERGFVFLLLKMKKKSEIDNSISVNRTTNRYYTIS